VLARHLEDRIAERRHHGRECGLPEAGGRQVRSDEVNVDGGKTPPQIVEHRLRAPERPAGEETLALISAGQGDLEPSPSGRGKDEGERKITLTPALSQGERETQSSPNLKCNRAAQPHSAQT